MYGADGLPRIWLLAWFSSTTTTMCANRGTCAARAATSGGAAGVAAPAVDVMVVVGSCVAGLLDGRLPLDAGLRAAPLLPHAASSRVAAAVIATARIRPWCRAA